MIIETGKCNSLSLLTALTRAPSLSLPLSRVFHNIDNINSSRGAYIPLREWRCRVGLTLAKLEKVALLSVLLKVIQTSQIKSQYHTVK
jgi:hypothetical protein